jgi:hypothetical protein
VCLVLLLFSIEPTDDCFWLGTKQAKTEEDQETISMVLFLYIVAVANYHHRERWVNLGPALPKQHDTR